MNFPTDKLDDVEARVIVLERKLREIESSAPEPTPKLTKNCGTCKHRHPFTSTCIKWDSIVQDASLVNMPCTLKCQYYK